MDNKPAYPQTGVASTCRSYEEYERMFGFDEERLPGEKVLDVAGGASSFTATLCARGIDAYAADPFYEGDREEILAAADREIETSSAKLASMAHIYDWSYYESPERHRRLREASLGMFARHFRSERSAHRMSRPACRICHFPTIRLRWRLAAIFFFFMPASSAKIFTRPLSASFCA